MARLARWVLILLGCNLWPLTDSGYEQGLRRAQAESLAAVDSALTDHERGQLRGEPRYQALVSEDPDSSAAYRSKDAIELTLQPAPEGA